MPIRILIADDHGVVAEGLKQLVEAESDMQVVALVGDGREAVQQARDTQPDVVLMDLSMPGMNGVEATRGLLALRPQTHVVVLTSFHDQNQVAGALEAGAVGYLLKDCDPRDVLAAIRSAASGHAPLDPRVARVLLPSTAAPKVSDSLSARELEVLQLVAKGLPNKLIGRNLGITERTVKVHVGHLFRRIGVADRTSAAIWARDNLPPDPAE